MAGYAKGSILREYLLLTVLKGEIIAERDRYKNALELINSLYLPSMCNVRIREIIRSAFNPNEPCPHCNGTGKIPNPESVCCDSCKFFHEYPMGQGGSCGPWDEDKVIRYPTDSRCDKHEFLCAMLSCDACGGKPFQKGE